MRLKSATSMRLVPSTFIFETPPARRLVNCSALPLERFRVDSVLERLKRLHDVPVQLVLARASPQLMEGISSIVKVREHRRNEQIQHSHRGALQ